MGWVLNYTLPIRYPILTRDILQSIAEYIDDELDWNAFAQVNKKTSEVARQLKSKKFEEFGIKHFYEDKFEEITQRNMFRAPDILLIPKFRKEYQDGRLVEWMTLPPEFEPRSRGRVYLGPGIKVRRERKIIKKAVMNALNVGWSTVHKWTEWEPCREYD